MGGGNLSFFIILSTKESCQLVLYTLTFLTRVYTYKRTQIKIILGLKLLIDKMNKNWFKKMKQKALYVKKKKKYLLFTHSVLDLILNIKCKIAFLIYNVVI